MFFNSFDLDDKFIYNSIDNYLNNFNCSEKFESYAPNLLSMFINLIHKYYNDNKYEILENCIADFLKTLKIIKDKKLSQEFYLKGDKVRYNKDVKKEINSTGLLSYLLLSFAHNLVTTEDFRKIIKMSKI